MAHKRKGRKRGHKKSHKGGHVPLNILEHRLKKLYNVVEKRGGTVPHE